MSALKKWLPALRRVTGWRPWRKRSAVANQTQGAAKRAFRILARTYGGVPEGELESAASEIARNTHKVLPNRTELELGTHVQASYNPLTKTMKIDSRQRGAEKRATIVHEVCHALNIGNDFLTANAVEGYFRRHRSDRVLERRA